MKAVSLERRQPHAADGLHLHTAVSATCFAAAAYDARIAYDLQPVWSSLFR